MYRKNGRIKIIAFIALLFFSILPLQSTTTTAYACNGGGGGGGGGSDSDSSPGGSSGGSPGMVDDFIADQHAPDSFETTNNDLAVGEEEEGEAQQEQQTPEQPQLAETPPEPPAAPTRTPEQIARDRAADAEFREAEQAINDYWAHTAEQELENAAVMGAMENIASGIQHVNNVAAGVVGAAIAAPYAAATAIGIGIGSAFTALTSIVGNVAEGKDLSADTAANVGISALVGGITSKIPGGDLAQSIVGDLASTAISAIRSWW